MRILLIVISTLLSFVTTSCSRKSIAALRKEGLNVTEQALTLDTNGKRDKIIQIQYMGCGGILIRQSGLIVLIDPFFSHQRFFKIGLSMAGLAKIRSKPAAIALGKQRMLDSLGITNELFKNEAKAIFVAHGHYDHLMDVPYISKYWFNETIDVYANVSSVNTCANVIDSIQLHNIEPMASNRNQLGKSLAFKSQDNLVVRVYPILAAHNPHSHNIKLFSGSIAHPPSKYKDPEGKTKVNDWLEGRTLSFLIDVEQDDDILFRMFVQSSSCEYPDGLPPEELLIKRKVDFAVLGVASYQFSETTYPCRYLEMLQPKKVMYIHWEDFFRKYNRSSKTVLQNDIPRFFNKILPACRPSDYILPVPGVVMSLKY